MVMLQEQLNKDLTKNEQARLKTYIQEENWKIFMQQFQLVIGERKDQLQNMQNIVGSIEDVSQALHV